MPGDKYVIRNIRAGLRREAELLADMWNRSESGWPGGWTGGVPVTTDDVLRNFMQRHCYACWVAEHCGEIVGYVSLEADPKEPTMCYIGLLNARPDHHGRGVGRRLLRRAVVRAVEGGFERVDLHTWGGNLKAVPLYKKCGFFWSPETEVHMQNFIPTILRMPLLADLFEGRDWYAIQERDLSVCEDLERWHGVRVFRYRFAADGRRADVLFDRQAGTLTAVETNEISVAAWVGREDLCALQEQVLRCELINKTDRPVRVTVLGRGEEGVPLAFDRSFTLSKSKRLRVPFRLPSDLEPRRPGRPPHRVFATVMVDGVPIRLGVGVRMRQPVEIEFDGHGFPAGKWTHMNIRLRNRLPFPVSGTLRFGAPAGLEVQGKPLRFRIKRKGWSNVPTRVCSARPKAHRLGLRVRFSEETAARFARGETPMLEPQCRVHEAWLRAFGPGEPVVSEDTQRRQITVESDRTRVVFQRAGGQLGWTRKSPRHQYVRGVPMSEAGPPFGHFHPVPPIYDAHVRRERARVRLTVRFEHERVEGLSIERTVDVTDGLLVIGHRLFNTAEEERDVQVRLYSWGGPGPGIFTIPDGEGLIRHSGPGWNDWPVGSELARRMDEFPESWMAVEEDGIVAGMVWQGNGVIEPNGSAGGRLTYDPVTVPAGGQAELPPLYLVGCGGDYRAVRSVWETFVRPDPVAEPERREPPMRETVRAALGGCPALMSGPGARRVELTITSDMKRVLAGEAVVALPAGLKVSGGEGPLRFAVKGLTKGKPFRRRMAVRADGRGPAAAVGELKLTTQRQERRLPLPVVILRGRSRKLDVRHAEDTVSVDTGVIRFTASARHGAGVVSLKHRKVELLRSSYPDAGPYWYMNKWYGGVGVAAGSSWDRRFMQADRRIEPVERRGTQGLLWRGARITAQCTHQDLRWLRYTVDYLGTAGSNLVAALLTVESLAKTQDGRNIYLSGWPAAEAARAWCERDGRPRPFTPDRHGYSVDAGHWAAFQRDGGPVMALVTDRRLNWELEIENIGDGRFGVEARRRVQLTEAHAYRYLGEFTELP